MRIVSEEEVKEMPINAIVYQRKNNYWRRSKYRLIQMHGLKLLQNIHTRALLTIKKRQAWHYEVDE